MRKPEKQKKQRERIYAALLCICTMLSLVSVPVLAAEMRKGAAPAGTALLMQVLFSGSSFQLAVLQQLERKRNADE